MMISMPEASVFVWRVRRSSAKAGNVGVLVRLVQEGLGWQTTGADHGGVVEVAEGFQVTRALFGVIRDFRLCLVDQAVPDGIQHRLVIAHRIDDGVGAIFLREGQGLEGRNVFERRWCPGAAAIQAATGQDGSAGFFQKRYASASRRQFS